LQLEIFFHADTPLRHRRGEIVSRKAKKTEEKKEEEKKEGGS
jgi:hypothetical protein